MNEKKINILLVEDEESHADLIARSFESTTVPVNLTLSRNLNEARISIAESVPDLVIADYILPDGKGTELIPANKEEPPYPIAIMTSHGNETTAVGAIKAGAFDYIVKSAATLDDMHNICEKILREWNHTIRHKRAEKELKESEVRFKSILSSLYESAIIIYDRDGKITALWGTPEMEKRYGIRAVDAIGRSIKDFVLPDQAEQKLSEIHRVFDAGEKMIVEYMVVFPEGNFWHEISLSPMRDANGNITEVVGFVRDVTDRRLAEKALKESEERYRTLVDTTNVIIWECDASWRFTYIGGQAVELFGYPIDEWFKENFWQDHIHPDDREKTVKLCMEYTQKSEDHLLEYRMMTADNNIIWVYDVVQVIDGNNGTKRLQGIIINITERKKMEESLIQSEKLKSIGTITAGISHEFNNFLAIISGNVQLLEESRKDDEELMDTFRTIMRAVNDGAQISRTMLQFTKSDKNNMVEFVTSELAELVRQTIAFTMPRWKNMARAKGINYHMNQEGITCVPSISCNPAEIRDVLVNIINNSLDAMPDGGCISFITWNNVDTVFLRVSDDGEGMPEEVKKKVFDPFFSTKGVEGTGLGMSMAYGIITSHSGQIKVNSEIGKGTTFTLQFPIPTKADSTKETPEQMQEPKSRDLRILVVDDDETIGNIQDKFLSRSGHKVKTADNGADAIDLIKAGDFDLVLCDLTIGYDVIKVINRLEKRPKIGIITGWEEKLSLIEREGIKVDFVQRKPIDFSELANHINDLGIKELA